MIKPIGTIEQTKIAFPHLEFDGFLEDKFGYTLMLEVEEVYTNVDDQITLIWRFIDNQY